MLRFLLIRLLRLIPTAWGIVSVVFILSRTLPTDQLLAQVLGEQLDVGSRTITPAERQAAEQAVRHRLGLDEPIFYFSIQRASTSVGPQWHWNGLQNQYHRWWRDLLRGELGRSYRDNSPVAQVLAEALRCTLPLTLLAAALAVGLSLWLALWMTQHPRGRTFLLTALYSLDTLPLFVVALVLLYSLANPDALALFPAYGFGSYELADSWPEAVGIYLYHLVLPILSLVLITLPGLIAQLDASLQQELQTAYVITAKAKGLAFWQVVRHHALRNALLPVVTLFTDLLPALVAGAVIVEVIFALPGMGRLLADAAATRDYPVLQAGVLLITLVRLLSHSIADSLYLRIDPRIRSSS
ncbi:ABC transporter permease [Hymenobacter cavernae]|uniref:Peptide ABC transporter n=1 Tax=Hymenobacter cavernae TaxID=2044852 RepID=A0ABQ1TJH4_9BACT|nr:ABC transporter permease [Hymenobacter cavernae]GGE96392.1 peptide ABC transporter [Hymenobacter cavernae]